MLYAHWEGFVKTASRYYLEYLAMQHLKNKELKPNLLALSLFTSLSSFPSATRKVSEYGKIVDFFSKDFSSVAKLPQKNGLDTKSNLSSEVLKEITWCLGVDYKYFETKEKFIDSHLLRRRNNVAHGLGHEINIDLDEYEQMRESVVEMMTYLKDQLENSACQGTYISQV